LEDALGSRAGARAGSTAQQPAIVATTKAARITLPIV